MSEEFDRYSWSENGLCLSSKDKEEIVETRDIIGVKENDGMVEIHLIQKCEDKKLKQKVVSFRNKENEPSGIVTDINEKLTKLPTRPSRLLVLISPMSGSQSGEQIYNERAAPVLELAGITTDVKVSQYSGHVTEILADYPLANVDGVVICGGDGSFNECMNGVFEYTQKSSNIDYNNPEAKLQTCRIPIAHIPTGTVNVINKFTNGCVDIETAVLSIIRGATGQLSIMNLYADGKWIRGACAGICHGNIAEFCYYADNFRWLKTARFLAMMPIYIFFKTLANFTATLTVLYRNENSTTSNEGVWEETIEGTFGDLLLGNHDTYLPDTYMGTPVWFNDHSLIHLYTTDHSRWQLFKTYLEINTKGAEMVYPPFVKVKPAMGYKIKVRKSNINFGDDEGHPVFRLTVDGEKQELRSSEWEIRLKEPVVTVYSSLS